MQHITDKYSFNCLTFLHRTSLPPPPPPSSSSSGGTSFTGHSRLLHQLAPFSTVLPGAALEICGWGVQSKGVWGTEVPPYTHYLKTPELRESHRSSWRWLGGGPDPRTPLDAAALGSYVLFHGELRPCRLCYWRWNAIHLRRAGLTIRRAPYQRKTGALFSYACPRFSLSSLGVHFSSPKKVDDFFKSSSLRLSLPTLHVQTSTQHDKNLAVDRGPPGGGAPLPWYNRHNG